jgi:hypothetical protein
MSGNAVNRPLDRFGESLRRLDRSSPEVIWVPAVVGCLAPLMSVVGAYRTGDLALGHRGLLWLLVCGLIAGQFLLLSRMFLRYLGDREVWIAPFAITWCLSTLEIECSSNVTVAEGAQPAT